MGRRDSNAEIGGSEWRDCSEGPTFNYTRRPYSALLVQDKPEAAGYCPE